MNKLQRKVYRNTLLALLGATRALARADVNVPSKWLAILDSVRVSSDMLHVKLSELDEDVEEDFIEKEENIERRLGKRNFYDEEELDHRHRPRNTTFSHGILRSSFRSTTTS